MVLEKTLESPLDCKEIQQVHPKGDQSWVFIGRTDVEAETPILGHLMRRHDSLEKTLMLGKIEGRRKGDGRGWGGWMAAPSQWTWVWASSGVSNGLGNLVCCSSWGCRVGHNLATEQQSIISGGFPTYLINGHFCIIICSTHTLYVRNVYMFL